MSISRNTTYNLIGSVLPLLLALATLPLYLQLIGTERYGVLSISFLFLGYFGLFDLGLGRATTYRIATLAKGEPQERADVLWTAVALNLAMGLAGSFVLWAGARYFFETHFETHPNLRAEILESLPLLALSLPVATLTGVLIGALQARGRFLETNIISVLSTSLFQILPLVVAWLGYGRLVPLLAAALTARAIAIVVLALRCHANIGRHCRIRFQRSEVRLLLGFGGWILLDGFLNPLLAMVDRFAIGAVLGGTAVTIYTVPYQLAQRVTIVPAAIQSAIFPLLPAASADERQLFARDSVRLLLAAMSPPLLIAIFAIHPFFRLWLGAELGEPSAAVGILILLGFWINSIAWAPYVWLQGTGRPDLVTKVHLIEVPPYLTMLYLGLTHYGLIGAGLVLIARNTLDATLLLLASRHARRLIEVALFAVPLATGAAIASFCAPRDPIFWMAGPILLAATLFLSWRILPDAAKHPLQRRLSRSSRPA